MNTGEFSRFEHLERRKGGREEGRVGGRESSVRGRKEGWEEG